MPEITEEFDEAAFDAEIKTIVQELKGYGYSKAHICERSFEIEEEARERLKARILNPQP